MLFLGFTGLVLFLMFWRAAPFFDPKRKGKRNGGAV